MDSLAFVTGADRGLGLLLCQRLLERGWQVFAGQFMPGWPELGALATTYPDRLHILRLDVSSTESVRTAARLVAQSMDHVDLVINNAGIGAPVGNRNLREPQDYDEMRYVYDVNSLGPLRVVEALLPLTDKSTLKRLCFVSSEAGSVARQTARTSWYGYCMSKSALNMAVRIMFNHLRPDGYTFRLYHPGGMRTFMSGVRNTTSGMEPEEAVVPALAYFLAEGLDEDQLIMRDWEGHDWPW
jgi:NAD(P)-dependent dehydrogenase (short-subunit alcohol dehydrogenase family)